VGTALSIKLPRSIVKRLEREAHKAGISVEEYLIEFLLRDLDPRDRAEGYIDAAKELLEQAKEELARGDVRQAAEKV